MVDMDVLRVIERKGRIHGHAGSQIRPSFKL
jgi:hypothetical protein